MTHRRIFLRKNVQNFGKSGNSNFLSGYIIFYVPLSVYDVMIDTKSHLKCLYYTTTINTSGIIFGISSVLI